MSPAVREMHLSVIEEVPVMLKPTKMAKIAGRNIGLVDRARAEAEILVKDARRVGVGVQKRAERALHDFEHGAETLLGGLEVRAVRAVAPVLRRAFATRREVGELRMALAALTGKVDDLERTEVARKVDEAVRRSP
jgi:hypothetical protein